ncbi:hypothetical protein HK102_006800, partial [Quaeritorhiza haematococci]
MDEMKAAPSTADTATTDTDTNTKTGHTGHDDGTTQSEISGTPEKAGKQCTSKKETKTKEADAKEAESKTAESKESSNDDMESDTKENRAFVESDLYAYYTMHLLGLPVEEDDPVNKAVFQKAVTIMSLGTFLKKNGYLQDDFLPEKHV